MKLEIGINPALTPLHFFALLVDELFKRLKLIFGPSVGGQVGSPTLDDAPTLVDLLDIFDTVKQHYAQGFTYRFR